MRSDKPQYAIPRVPPAAGRGRQESLSCISGAGRAWLLSFVIPVTATLVIARAGLLARGHA